MLLLERISVKVLGPRSKYDRALPYTYTARRPIFEGADEYVWYVADTVCQLIRELSGLGVTAREVEIFEVYQKREAPIDRYFYSDDMGQWIRRPMLCASFAERYPERPCNEVACAFRDRQ